MATPKRVKKEASRQLRISHPEQGRRILPLKMLPQGRHDNGLLRQYFPKAMSLLNVTVKEVWGGGSQAK